MVASSFRTYMQMMETEKLHCMLNTPGKITQCQYNSLLTTKATLELNAMKPILLIAKARML